MRPLSVPALRLHRRSRKVEQATKTDLIAGRYAILELVGTGAMGKVYRAHDLELDEVVALKMILADRVEIPGMLEKFREEVKLARRVTHRNVARVFDIGEHGDHRFLSMEFLEGEPLSAWIRRGGLPVNEAIDLVLPICHGLEAAHAVGVLHRDLKPDNIIVGTDGRVTVTDFGVACLVDRASEGGVAGTPAYMAPEQLMGTLDLDARADIYAVGLILFELLTGTPAFDGESVLAIAKARLSGPPPNPAARRPDLPPGLVSLVVKALATKREDRYPTVGDLAHDLASTSCGSGIRPVAPLATRDVTQIAVLPFAVASETDAYVADGLTEDLSDVLSMTRGLRVRKSPTDVQFVVDGSVRRDGKVFTIDVRLVAVKDGTRIWRKSFRRSVNELLALNDEVARAVSSALAAEMTGLHGLGTREGTVRRAPSDPRAIDMYFRARSLYREGWYRFEDVRDAVRLLESASALAPSDPSILAAFALGRARLVFLDRGDPDGARKRASETARRAVLLAPHHGEAWLALASVHVYEGASAKAVPALLHAMRVAPSLARAREMLGRILVEAGLVAEGRALLEAALALDPVTFTPRWDICQAHALVGEWDQVRTLLALAAPAESVRTLLRARFGLWQGRRSRHEIGPEPEGTDPGSIVARAFWRGAMGIEEAGVELDELVALALGRARRVLLQFSTEVRLASGAKGAAEALQEAVDVGLDDLAWLDGCPLLAPLRTHPRWATWHATVAERARHVRIAWAASVTSNDA